MLRPRPSTAFPTRAGFPASPDIGNFVRSCLSRGRAPREDGIGQKNQSRSGLLPPFGSSGPLRQFAICGAFGLLAGATLPAATESAIANGDTRTLELYNPHTNESIAATYRVDGRYDPAVLEKLNWFLRDWRRNEATKMDPRLFDAVWETYREAGATSPVHVVCGYRSPQTNAMLRRRSRAVAQHSQHMLGRAMDTTMPGMSMEKVREVAMRLQMGGVGFYGDSSFVHIDVGNVRYWPRMTYAQLARVFPDGKTVLIPSNGKPLPGYEEARAELASSGRVAQVPPAENGKNFFAWLFGAGKGADESEEETAQQVTAARSGAAQKSQVAMAESAPEAEAAQDVKSTPSAAHAAKGETASSEELPVPPHRPNDFLALAEVPLPPDRPAPFVTASLPTNAATDTGAAADPIGDLAKASPPPPAARVANLPTIITDGASESALARGEGGAAPPEPQVLAYAPMAQMEGLRSAVHDTAGRKADKTGWAAPAARLELPSPVEMAKLENEMMLAPTLTGLRRAARIETAALSKKLAAGYLARFGSVATNLPTDRFVGPAVAGLRSGRNRLVLVDGSAAVEQGD